MTKGETMDLRRALQLMQGRSRILCQAIPQARTRLEGLEEDFKQAVVELDMENADSRAKMKALLDRARSNDPEAVSELNALRSTSIDLYVRATSNFTQFFEEITLQPNEQAMFETTFRNQVNVRRMAQDGDSRQVKAVKSKKQTFIDMIELTTDEVVYPIRDINLGTDVNAAAKATVDLAYDAANKVDVDAKALVDASIGSFVTTGASLSRTYIPNDRIVTANLPSTNDLNCSDNTSSGATSKFRIEVCRTVIRYCEFWANIWGAPIRPTGVILVPSIDCTDLLLGLEPNTLIFPNTLTEAALENYTQFSYAGIKWTLVPDVTLPHGICYPILNRKLGHRYTKPSMNEEIVETDRRKNLETRVQRIVHNFAVPEPWRVNVCTVTYDADQQ